METAKAAELLAAERARIEGQLARLGAEFAPGAADGLANDAGYDDGAFDLHERERDSGRIEELRAELTAVERAERRLEEGTYGLSVESGEPISDARLARLPAAERTAEEQRRFERLGG